MAWWKQACSAVSQSDARFENLSELTRILTWKVLSNAGSRSINIFLTITLVHYNQNTRFSLFHLFNGITPGETDGFPGTDDCLASKTTQCCKFYAPNSVSASYQHFDVEGPSAGRPPQAICRQITNPQSAGRFLTSSAATLANVTRPTKCFS